MDYIIKRCEYEELHTVAHLYNELSRELKQSTKKQDDTEIANTEIEDATMFRILRSAIKECNLIIFVAKQEDKVIGFIAGSIREGANECYCRGPVGFVEGAYVLQEYDRENILNKLEEEIAKEFQINRAIYHKGVMTYEINGV